MDNRHFRNITTGIIIFVLVAAALLGVGYFSVNNYSAAAASVRGAKLRVAFSSSSGIIEEDEYGNRTGILIDYLNEIAKYTDWEYEYIDVNADDMIAGFDKGEYDLMGGVYYSADADGVQYGYADYPMGTSHSTLTFRKDDPDLKSYDISTLNGKTIGVYENAKEKIRRLEIFLASNNLNCTLRHFSYEELKPDGNLYRFLRNGEVDVLLGNDTDIVDEFALFTMYQGQPYYLVTQPKATGLLAALNGALEKIMEINPNFAEDIYNKNMGDIVPAYVKLNDAERAYVKGRGVVKVGIMHNWHPFYCEDLVSVSHRGLIPDVLERISGFSGLQFEYVFYDKYADIIAAVQNGSVDILSCYNEGDENAFAQGLARTESFAMLNNTIIKNKSVKFPGTDLRGGIVRGRTMENGLTSKDPVYFDTTAEALAALDKGDIDFFSGLSAVIEREMQLRSYKNLMFVSSVNTSRNVAFALGRPVEVELYSILNKSIRSISSAEKTSITNKNVVSEGSVSSPSLSEIIAANPIAFVFIICAFFLLLTGGVLVFVRFRYRAKIMQADLEKAEARSRAKSDFLSRMSHEIRTPMNAIVGLTDLVAAEPGLTEGAKDKVDKIRSSSDYLLSLINDILDMSRIENNKLTLEPECFSLRHTLDEIDKLTDVLAARKGVVYETSREFEHDTLTSDPVRLRQVIVNLVSNAVKFTPAGKKIYLAAKEISADDQSATFEFSVADEGIGISPEDIQRVFKAFEQAGTNLTKSEGTGLGLAISSSIVQLMGSALEVESEPGRGSRFFFKVTLPLGGCEATPKTLISENCLRGVHVLLAEDNDINAEIAVELLAMYGADTDRAANGREAVDMFTAADDGRYDVILMDLKMPVMDGLEATREIRSCARKDAHTVPIVAMTANSFVEDRRATEEAGMNGFVPKPVNMEQLVATVRDLAAKGREGRA